jgi:hypothetical protein
MNRGLNELNTYKNLFIFVTDQTRHLNIAVFCVNIPVNTYIFTPQIEKQTYCPGVEAGRSDYLNFFWGGGGRFLLFEDVTLHSG